MIAILLCALFLAGAPVSASAAPAEADLFSEAESRYLGRNFTAALEAYDTFLAAYPLSERVADVQYRRAVCMYRLARYKDAVTLTAEIERRYRSTRWFAWVPLWAGLSQYELGSYSLAVDRLDAFLAGPPDPELTPQALLHKALALHQLSNDPAAVEALRALVGSYTAAPVYPYAVVLLGTLLQQSGKGDDLLALSQSTDGSSFPAPWKSELQLLKAEALWGAGRYDEAQPLYIQLVGAPDDVALVAYARLFSSAQRRADLAGMRDLAQAAETRFTGRTALLSQLWTRVGVESFKAGAADAAEQFLRRAWNARTVVPVNEAVPLYLAELLLQRKDPVGARQMLLDFLAAGKPGTGAVIIRLGDLSLMGDDFAGAATWYAQFRATLPDSKRAPEAGSLLAYCLYRQDKDAEAARLVDQLLTQDAEPGIVRQLRKLRIVLYNRDGRTADAALALQSYVASYPEELRPRLDYLKALFVLQRSPQVVAAADDLRRQFPTVASQDPYAAIVTSYLRGLSLITAKDYRRAADDLSSIDPDAAARAGLAAIVPYARYYLGWAWLRTSDFARASQVFDALAAAYPSHELSPMTVYLAGWSHFSAGEFDKAATYFTRGSPQGAKGAPQSELAQKSQYLLAKSLLNQKKLADAVPVLQGIVGATPASPWAADAQFDYAGALADLGQTRAAADAFRRLFDSWPDSPLREEALYRRADTFMTHSMPADARAAFDEYRTRYPKGKLVDAALYWGGVAAQGMGEGMAAALLWEQLVSGFKESTFRASALQQTAEIYAQAGQYAKSLADYTIFLKDFPDEARAARADIRAEQIRLLAQGEGDREAALSALIAKGDPAAKRQATIDLARLYIYAGDKRADTGYKLLLPVIKEGEPKAAADAQALVGEYWYRKGDLAEAAKQFIAVAVIPGVDPGPAAAALYRAAEMMQLAKRPADVTAILKRLEAGFPASEWTVKARLLAGGAS
jgi:TolA-binding protein